MPKISVIVPVYKVEPFLRRCVDSLLGQSFTDFDLILVDDGSPDSCGSMCDAYAKLDSRVAVIHRENGGLSAARNSGIDWSFEHSGSQWLAFVDSDDWVHKDYLKRLYEAVENSGCKISACGFFRTTDGEFPAVGEADCTVMEAGDYYCSDSVHDGVTAVAWNKLYHKSLFGTLRYPVGKLHEDEFTTYRAVYQAGQVAVMEDVLYAYYQNPAGIMRSSWNPKRMHVLEAFEEQIAFAKEAGDKGLLKKAVLKSIFSIHEHLGQASEAYKKELRKKLRLALKQGKELGIFPRSWENLWAYEVAYPVKIFWWLLFKLGSGGNA